MLEYQIEYFSEACGQGDIETVLLLINKYKNKADITNLIRANNYAGFRWACENGHIEIVDLLLKTCGPVMKLKQNTMSKYNSSDNDICAICQEPYSHPIITACCHKFCYDCMLNWMKRSQTCPICRTLITEDDLVKLDISNT